MMILNVSKEDYKDYMNNLAIYKEAIREVIKFKDTNSTEGKIYHLLDTIIHNQERILIDGLVSTKKNTTNDNSTEAERDKR